MNIIRTLAGRSPELNGVVAWINSKPLFLRNLHGKVVLIDFWTYSCVNCLNTIPHMKALHKKYAKHGLVIIGVHTPEFTFEKNTDNVKAAVKRLGIEYPVVVDSELEVWNAFGNSYWPRQYLINKEGKIIYDHVGEGGYEEIERNVRKALAEAGANLNREAQIAAPKEKSRAKGFLFITPEIYLGYARSKGFGNAKVCIPGSCEHYVDAKEHVEHIPYLHGDWAQHKEFLGHEKGESGYIALKYVARKANIVLGSASGKPYTMAVTLDGKPVPKNMAGSDIKRDDKTGATYILVDRPDMYNLTSIPEFEKHELRLITNSDDCAAYTFTFS
ncbi:redoxin domain-containing protein [Candidatus Woesearchaeota archaeon]|nr:redoxin domain-containing protein [Candidatus Woesearchaeota archaeon]